MDTSLRDGQKPEKQPFVLFISGREKAAVVVGPAETFVIGPSGGEASWTRDTPGAAVCEHLRVLERYAAELVNQERGTMGNMSGLEWMESLAMVARDYGRHQLGMGSISHLDEQGRGPDWRLKANGIPFTLCGENIAFMKPVLSPDLEVLEYLHRGLVDSPHHRANILNPDFEQIGVGLEWEGWALVMTQLFCRAKWAT